jgi:hypothetical protein
MATNEKMKALDEAVATARRHYDEMIANADTALENFRNERALTISHSAAHVAGLETALEFAEGFEREGEAARLRLEIAASMERHKACVDGADARLRHAIEDHARRISSAGMAMECALNAALARAGS